jgi:hypothetical protein
MEAARMTRRQWWRTSLGALLAEPPAPNRRHRREYRVDADITLLGIAIFSRANVGKGFASAEETGQSAGRTLTLRFGAGSIPARARGLNRLGFFEEIALERGGKFTEGTYFGYMTSSPEKGLDEARKALETSGGRIPYAAAQGRIGAAGATGAIARFPLSGELTWEQQEAITRQVRGGFAAGTAETKSVGGGALSFLYTVLQGIRMQGPKYSGRAVYNGKMYQLTMSKERDEKTARKLVEKRLTANADLVRRISGVVRNEATGSNSPFKLWIEERMETPVPLRIEYQARSFLRLVFEQTPV